MNNLIKILIIITTLIIFTSCEKEYIQLPIEEETSTLKSSQVDTTEYLEFPEWEVEKIIIN